MNFIRSLIHVFRHNKMASLLSIAGLAVAFASFIVIMTQVRYELTYNRHYRNADRIFRIENADPSTDGKFEIALSRILGEELSRTSPDIEKFGTFSEEGVQPVYDESDGTAEESDRVACYKASPSLLDVLEFRCVAGDFTRFSAPNTVAISQTTARAIYGDKDPIGRRIVIPGKTCEIVAVYADFPENSDIACNSLLSRLGDAEGIENTGQWPYEYYVLASSPDVKARIESAFSRYAENDLPKNYDGYEIEFRLSPIGELHFLPDLLNTTNTSRSTVYALIAIAIVILLVAMINYVNFAMALVPLRIRYFNVQKVLGGSNGRIRRNLVGESVFIAFVAFLLAIFAVRYLSGTSLVSLFDARIDLSANWPVVLFTGCMAVLCSIVSGIYPAFYSTSFSPVLALKGSFGLSAKGRTLRTGLISFQYIVSIVLIIAAISIGRQNRYMRMFDMGFSRDNILTVSLPNSFGGKQEAFADRLKSLPAITDVTFAQSRLVEHSRGYAGFKFKGKDIRFDLYYVARNFLDFMGLKVKDGRNFTPAARNVRAMIFNETAHKQDSIMLGDMLVGGEVVGIVADFHSQPLQYGVQPFAFVSTDEKELFYALIRVNTADVGPIVAYIRRTMAEFDPAAKDRVQFLDENIGQMYQKEENLSRLIAAAALLSVLIAVLGVFGVMLFEVRYRRKEIGLRKVHGATIGEILWMFNRGYVRLVLICFVIASPVAYWIVSRWLGGFAYQVPFGPWTYLAALALVLGVTVATISLQCLKTATENPVRSIKTE